MAIEEDYETILPVAWILSAIGTDFLNGWRASLSADGEDTVELAGLLYQLYKVFYLLLNMLVHMAIWNNERV